LDDSALRLERELRSAEYSLHPRDAAAEGASDLALFTILEAAYSSRRQSAGSVVTCAQLSPHTLILPKSLPPSEKHLPIAELHVA
jgi:hypothetical protein